MGTALVEFLLIIGGLYLIWRLVLKLWLWADIKQKEEDLSTIEKQQAEVERIEKSHPIDEVETKKKVRKFVKKGKQL